MKFNNILKNIFISWMFLGTLLFLGAQQSVLASSSPSLSQKLKQTNNKRYYFQQKKRQADLKLRTEKNKLSNNQQKLERAHQELQATTMRYNALIANLSSMESQLNSAITEFRSIDAAMKSRIRQVYKHQRTGMFELILSARDVNTLMDMFYFEK